MPEIIFNEDKSKFRNPETNRWIAHGSKHHKRLLAKGLENIPPLELEEPEKPKLKLRVDVEDVEVPVDPEPVVDKVDNFWEEPLPPKQKEVKVKVKVAPKLSEEDKVKVQGLIDKTITYAEVFDDEINRDNLILTNLTVAEAEAQLKEIESILSIVPDRGGIGLMLADRVWDGVEYIEPCLTGLKDELNSQNRYKKLVRQLAVKYGIVLSSRIPPELQLAFIVSETALSIGALKIYEKYLEDDTGRQPPHQDDIDPLDKLDALIPNIPEYRGRLPILDTTPLSRDDGGLA